MEIPHDPQPCGAYGFFLHYSVLVIMESDTSWEQGLAWLSPYFPYASFVDPTKEKRRGFFEEWTMPICFFWTVRGPHEVRGRIWTGWLTWIGTEPGKEETAEDDGERRDLKLDDLAFVSVQDSIGIPAGRCC